MHGQKKITWYATPVQMHENSNSEQKECQFDGKTATKNPAVADSNNNNNSKPIPVTQNIQQWLSELTRSHKKTTKLNEAINCNKSLTHHLY